MMASGMDIVTEDKPNNGDEPELRGVDNITIQSNDAEEAIATSPVENKTDTEETTATQPIENDFHEIDDLTAQLNDPKEPNWLASSKYGLNWEPVSEQEEDNKSDATTDDVDSAITDLEEAIDDKGEELNFAGR